jgi:hypothetical protein
MRAVKTIEIVGAGEGNRTLVISLEGYVQALHNQEQLTLFEGQ